jgi:hypothetical protein
MEKMGGDKRILEKFGSSVGKSVILCQLFQN